MSLTPILCLAALAACLGFTPLAAAVYHVDHLGGSDAADGLSPAQAWKHCPGDRNAAGVPAATTLAPGDTVRFKGGVAYHGSPVLTVSGTVEAPITFDGNLDGTYGTGPAVIDGGQVLTGWRRYQSQEEAEGNPRWADLFQVEIDLDIHANFDHGEVVAHRQVPRDRQAPWQRIILCDGDRSLLPIAQFPKPSDRFYPDLPRDFLRSPHRIETTDAGSSFVDAEHLTAPAADHHRGMFLGVHGGNNHVYFTAITGYDPAAHRLHFPIFKPSTYPQTAYAFYNSLRLISEPGEWSIAPVGDKRFRITLLPERLVDGQPANIGFPVLETGIAVRDGASHIAIRGFLVQRFSGGAGGVSVARADRRSVGITISDCEIRFVAGHAGIGLNYCDEVMVENCFIHSCPAWTSGVFLSRVNRYAVRDCRLVKNSGSGIRHYECRQGELRGNAILDHYGMHSSAMNIYEGCADLVVEANYIQNVLAINRNAERIVVRNNVIDSQGRNAAPVSMWTSGTVGGKDLKDIQFIRNTLINARVESDWSTAIFGQRGRGASEPSGLVVRDNILDRLTDLPGTFAGNIVLRGSPERYLADGGLLVEDASSLFLDPGAGDYRRRPDSILPQAGADIPPPPQAWSGRRSAQQ